MSKGRLWINNQENDRLAMLQQTETGHPNININAIEKDWWVTICLKALFMCDCSTHLLFKGGTSSKELGERLPKYERLFHIR